ncbi:NUDIX hydrolase [Nitrincola lacisaponensis]|uniref:NUDIX hydrolase n=1 Tax=Nitrincola lacisaponensis TaxID=267850 RepID=UPI00056A5A06|nr:NUDIX hydrolase [Nitrincola lacisaponensis]
MKYCSNCGAVVEQKIPAGDNRHRYVCGHCHTVHYENPCIIAGCLPVYQDQVLLCKRAIEPRYGLWTLPAGFMENGESTEQAALRETLEEANAVVKIRSLYTLTSILHVDQVQMIYLADLPTPEFSISEESLEVRLFTEADIPWDQLAFPTIRNALQFYFSDRKTGHFPLRHLALSQGPQGELCCELGTHQ